tara:strand:+ start:344 stop:1267 length:924 start_codon:yes stop_codon:yes gene_type:complete
MTQALVITDVGPRDGLQSQSAMLATADKLRLIQALFDAGLPSVEATSFVAPKAVPQMADADQLLPRVSPPGQARVSALVPNLRGLERAMTAGAREIAVVLSSTDTMNRRNIGMDLRTATDVSIATLQRASDAALHCRAYLAVAFECPFEGATPMDRVVRLALEMEQAGAREIVIADTIGAAAPAQVQRLTEQLLRAGIASERIGMHLHDTRGMALANAWAALQLGVRRFDASIGGLGGCPFAPGAAGNLATEDLVLMARQCGFDTGVDIQALVDTVDMVEQLVGYPVGGRGARWLRSRRGQSSVVQE